MAEEKKKLKKKTTGEGKTKRQKAEWKAKQLQRLTRAEKTLAKLASVIVASKAPNVTADLATAAHTGIKTLVAQVTTLPNDWKPARGNRPGTTNKVGIGTIVKVKDDLNRDEIKLFKHIPAELFANAVVIEDDGRDWLVKCADGTTRVLRKKLATFAVAPKKEDKT